MNKFIKKKIHNTLSIAFCGLALLSMTACEQKESKQDNTTVTNEVKATDKDVNDVQISKEAEQVVLSFIENEIKEGRLKKENIKTYMLTGDNERTAKVIAEKLGIDDVIAEVSPEDKYKKVKELQEQGKKVAMIGDGINDSPALAQADVGMAIGSGTDIAIESADIVLMGKDIEVILTAIRLSRATIKNIKENLFWAFFYNTCGIPIAGGLLYLFTGHLLNPMIAGLAMGLSSVTVVSNALRLKRFK